MSQEIAECLISNNWDMEDRPVQEDMKGQVLHERE